MNTAQTQVFDFQGIRGIFAPSPTNRRLARIYSLFFIVLLPAILVYAGFSSGEWRRPFTADHWAVLVTLLLSPALGWFFWYNADREWHFTGKEILAYRRGREAWRVPLDSITDAKIGHASYNALWLHITANRNRYSIPLVPGLRQHFAQRA